jgi:hypothetical protein
VNYSNQSQDFQAHNRQIYIYDTFTNLNLFKSL